MVPCKKALLGIILFLLKGGMRMDYDTEMKNLRNSMLELKTKILMMKSKKNVPDFAEQIENYTKEYNELKRKYAILTMEQRQEKKEGR